jgi:hypothetical protein
MAFTLIYTGEHFLIDILVGWIYAAATVYFGGKILDRWDARQKRRHPEELGDLPTLEPAAVNGHGNGVAHGFEPSTLSPRS